MKFKFYFLENCKKENERYITKRQAKEMLGEYEYEDMLDGARSLYEVYPEDEYAFFVYKKVHAIIIRREEN